MGIESSIGLGANRTLGAKCICPRLTLRSNGSICTVPWDDAGPYLRFSVTFVAKGEADERRVIAEIEKRFAGLKFEF